MTALRFLSAALLLSVLVGCSSGPPELELTVGDSMRYSATELTASPGEVTITLRHTGQMSRDVMGHNVVILQPGADVDAFVSSAIEAGASRNYVPEDHPDVVANSRLIGGGEITTFTTQLATGTYAFLCSFPGHSALMRGTLEVK